MCLVVARQLISELDSTGLLAVVNHLRKMDFLVPWRRESKGVVVLLPRKDRSDCPPMPICGGQVIILLVYILLEALREIRTLSACLLTVVTCITDESYSRVVKGYLLRFCVKALFSPTVHLCPTLPIRY